MSSKKKQEARDRVAFIKKVNRVAENSRGIDLDRPLIDQLVFCPQAAEKSKTSFQEDEITPEIIRQRAAEIQKTWSKRDERIRAGREPSSYSIPEVSSPVISSRKVSE